MPIWSWLRRRRLDEDDFQDEIRSHLAMAAAERVAEGADPRSARLASLKDFGNVSQTTERARGVWRPRWVAIVSDLVKDFRYAVRGLSRNPAFSLTVIGVLALGIGLNAAVFMMLKSMALTPLAGVARSAWLRVIYAETSTGRDVTLSYPDYRDLRDRDQSFAGLFATVHARVTLGRGRAARQVSSEFVTGNYFQALGVAARHGRTLLPADEIAASRHPVVVISDSLWRREFGADPAVVGRALDINNQTLTVVGVTEPTYHGTIVSYDVELFIPVMMLADLGFGFGMPADTPPAQILADRRLAMLGVMGYPRPGVTIDGAEAAVQATWTTLSPERRLTDANLRLRVVPLWRDPNSAQSYALPTVLFLTGTALFVLLIACANIAGLVLVRGLSRRGEIALRLALGATRARVVRLLLIENLVLALPGAVLGVALAVRGLPWLIDIAQGMAAPQRLFFNVDVDFLVIAFAVLVACGCALVFGLAPTLSSARIDLVSAINQDASPAAPPAAACGPGS